MSRILPTVWKLMGLEGREEGREGREERRAGREGEWGGIMQGTQGREGGRDGRRESRGYVCAYLCWLPGVLAHRMVVVSLMWIQFLGPQRSLPSSGFPQQPKDLGSTPMQGV